MKKYLNGEVFFVLFLFGGAYKSALAFLPDFLDVTVIFMVLSMLIGLNKTLARKSINKKIIIPFVLYTSIIFICCISLFYVDSSSYSTNKLLRLIIVTGWAYLGPFILIDYSNPGKSLKRIMGTMVFIGVSIGAVSVFDYLTNAMPGKTATAFGSENYLPLGRVTAVASLIIACYYLFKKTTKKTFFLTAIAVPVTIYALFVSGGRMPVIAFVISLFISLFLGVEIKSLKGFKGLKNISINKKILKYLYFGVWLLPVVIYLVTKSNFFARFLALFEQQGGGASAGARLTNYKTALEMISHSNLMGMGIGSYLSYTGGSGDRAYPHNIFLEIVAELGVQGLLVFSLILMASLFIYIKSPNKKNFYSVSIIALFVFFFLNSMVSGDLNDNRFLFFSISLLYLSDVFLKESSTSVNNLEESKI